MPPRLHLLPPRLLVAGLLGASCGAFAQTAEPAAPAATPEHSLTFKPGVHIYNFIDKPDFTMNNLVGIVNRVFGRSEKIRFRLPFVVGYMIGKGFDGVAAMTGKRFAISAIRVKKFCANSVYNTALDQTGFKPPVPLEKALEQTVRHEFIESHQAEEVFYTE